MDTRTNTARAFAPPAFSIASSSPVFMPGLHTTCNPVVNGLCNILLNDSCSFAVMKERVIDRALRRARELKLGKSAFARALHVSPQSVTNWQSRDMPAGMHAAAARALGLTVDQYCVEIDFQEPLPGRPGGFKPLDDPPK